MNTPNSRFQQVAMRLLAYSNALFDELILFRKELKELEHRVWKRINKILLWFFIIFLAFAILSQFIPALRVDASPSLSPTPTVSSAPSLSSTSTVAPTPVISPAASLSPTPTASPKPIASPTPSMTPAPDISKSPRSMALSRGRAFDGTGAIQSQRSTMSLADNPTATPDIATSINFDSTFGAYTPGSHCLDLPNQPFDESRYPPPAPGTGQNEFSQIPPCPGDNKMYQEMGAPFEKCRSDHHKEVDTVAEQTSEVQALAKCVSDAVDNPPTKCDFTDTNLDAARKANIICNSGHRYAREIGTCSISYDPNWDVTVKATTTTTTTTSGNSSSSTSTPPPIGYPPSDWPQQLSDCNNKAQTEYVQNVIQALPACIPGYDPNDFAPTCVAKSTISTDVSEDDILTSTPAGLTYNGKLTSDVILVMQGLGLSLLVISIVYLGHIFLVGGVFLNDGNSFNSKQYILTLVVAAIAIKESSFFMQLLIELSDDIIKFLAAAFDPSGNGDTGMTNLKNYVDIGWPRYPSFNLFDIGGWIVGWLLAVIEWLFRMVIGAQMLYRLLMIDICLIFAPVAFFLLTIPQAKRWFTFWINMFFANLFAQPAQLAVLLMSMRVRDWADHAVSNSDGAWHYLFEFVGFIVAIMMASRVAAMFDHQQFFDVGSAGMSIAKSIALSPLKGLSYLAKRGGSILDQKYGLGKQLTLATERNKLISQSTSDPSKRAKMVEDISKGYAAGNISRKQVARSILTDADKRAVFTGTVGAKPASAARANPPVPGVAGQNLPDAGQHGAGPHGPGGTAAGAPQAPLGPGPRLRGNMRGGFGTNMYLPRQLGQAGQPPMPEGQARVLNDPAGRRFWDIAGDPRRQLDYSLHGINGHLRRNLPTAPRHFRQRAAPAHAFPQGNQPGQADDLGVPNPVDNLPPAVQNIVQQQQQQRQDPQQEQQAERADRLQEQLDRRNRNRIRGIRR